MADGTDPLQGLQFLLGALIAVATAAQVAKDELDRLVHPAGGFGAPDLTKTAAAQALDQAIARNRFGVRFRALP